MSKAREPVSSETSSGEEETDDSSSEEIGSEPEPIRKSSAPPAAARKPQTPSAIMPAPSDEDSESESDKRSRKKSNAKGKDKAASASASASASAARSTRKRAVEEVKGTEPTVTKKSKNSKKAEPEKKQLFQRIWSEADEITILKGILQFRAEKKSDPNDNFDSFFELIKKNLQIDATRAQLRDKISRMKRKYTNNKKKEHDGKVRNFTSQHEQEAYDLSEKVWGAVKENANASGAAEKENRVERGNGSGAAEEENRVEMEDEEALKNLEIKEMEVSVKHFELKAQRAKLLLQMMIESRGH